MIIFHSSQLNLIKLSVSDTESQTLCQSDPVSLGYRFSHILIGDKERFERLDQFNL